jgi:hypothetical protein
MLRRSGIFFPPFLMKFRYLNEVAGSIAELNDFDEQDVQLFLVLVEHEKQVYL